MPVNYKLKNMKECLVKAEDSIDSGDPVDIDENEDAPRKKIINVGYGKANIESDDLLITSKNVFVPNAYDYLDDNDNKVSAGYFSYSALTNYRRCQRNFFHKYVEKKRRAQMAPKMWGGSAMHEIVEYALHQKLKDPSLAKAVKEVYKEHPHDFSMFKVAERYPTAGFTTEELRTLFKKSYGEFSQSYDEARARAINNNEEPLQEVSWGAKCESEEQFHVLYLNAITQYIQDEFPRVTPESIEDLVVYHFPLDSGGTVPIVGFVDLVETTNYMGHYYDDVTRKADQFKGHEDLAKKTIKTIENGELMITDHKCGMAKSYESARIDQQLTLYSMAKKIPVVGFDSLALGTSGGKNPAKAKPANINKIFARRTDQDYEALTTDFNAIIKGISSGIYDKTGMTNMMVCSPSLCEFYGRCFPGK